MATPSTVVVAGAMAQRPQHGGHAWVFLQYLLGFRSLGWEVLFLDRMDPGVCVDDRGRPSSLVSSANVRYVSDVMDRAGLSEDWAVLCGEDETAGLARHEVLERIRRSAMLINVMGYLNDDEILESSPLKVFLDIDPGFGQIWQASGLAEPFGGHDRYVTVGGRVGHADCSIPTCGIDWLTILPPVHLPAWEPSPRPGGRFTSVASWRGPFGPLVYGGRTYGLRVHEFRRFLRLPELTQAEFELALDIDPAEVDDLRRLHEHGWLLVDPVAAAGTPDRYRDFVAGSAAELMVAKNLYVDTHSGWFSDRSACYLAAAKPVLAQDTGLEHLLPLGDGLVPFEDLDQATSGAESIVTDYAHHSRAAREVAEEHLAADRVLARLLESLGVA